MELRNKEIHDAVANANLNSSVRNKELRNAWDKIENSEIYCHVFFGGCKRSPETDGDYFDLLFTKGMICSIRVDVDYISEVINSIYRFVKIIAVVVLPNALLGMYRVEIIYEVL